MCYVQLIKICVLESKGKDLCFCAEVSTKDLLLHHVERMTVVLRGPFRVM